MLLEDTKPSWATMYTAEQYRQLRIEALFWAYLGLLDDHIEHHARAHLVDDLLELGAIP